MGWRETSAAAAILLLLAVLHTAAGQTEALPDPTYFAPVQAAGDMTSGFSAYFVGCADNGATLQDILVYSNDNFLRGMEVNMTDGRHVLLGCVNTTSSYTGCTPGHLDADIRSAAFSFAPGELVTALTLWAGPDNKGTPNARAGALRFATSLGRIFDFGNKKSRDGGVDVSVGSGVPCGIAARRGADIDALGFVFLRRAVSSVLTDVTYSGIPTNEAHGATFQANYSVIQQQNMTYDNSGNSEPHTYTYASEFGQARPSQWSHAPGLDSYAGPNVTAGVPQLATSGNNSTPQGWVVTAPEAHQRSEDGLQADQWSYNVPVPAGAIYAVHVSLLQARITVPFHGNLTVVLDNGAALTIPTQGVYEGVTYAPADVDLEVVKPPTSAANTSLLGTNVVNSAPTRSDGSTSKNWAIALGVILGIILAGTLAAVFIILSKRRKQKQAASTNANHLGTSHDFVGGTPDPKAQGAAAAGGTRAFSTGVMSSFKKKAIKPVTPKATQAPPAAGSPQHGLWSVLPAGVLAKRFQRLFRGRGNAEEDLAERGLSTTSTHEHAPEIPLGPEPSPTKGFGAAEKAAGTGEMQTGSTTPDAKVGSAPATPKVVGSGSGSSAQSSRAASVADSPLGRLTSRGSIEHEGTPIKLSGRARQAAAKSGSGGSIAAAAEKAAKPGRIEHDNTNIKLGAK